MSTVGQFIVTQMSANGEARFGIDPLVCKLHSKKVSGTGLNPPVTWLLPVKNGMPYLPETLASVAAQTYSNFLDIGLGQ